MRWFLRFCYALIALAVLTAVGFAGSIYWRTELRPFESTDNAYIRSHMARLSPQITGYIKQIRFDDNQQVDAGDLLIIIDDVDIRARIAQAEAQVAARAARMATVVAQKEVQAARVAQQEAAITGVIAGLEQARSDQKRFSNLVAEGAVSAQDKDATDARAKLAQAQLAQTRAAAQEAASQFAILDSQIAETEVAIKVAQSALAVAQVELGHTHLYAPIRGMLGNRSVQVGQLVQPGAVLAYLIPSEELFVEANFKETQLEDMRPGQPVTIEVDAYPNSVFNGVVASTAPASGSEFSILPPENATGNFTKIVRRVPVKIKFEPGTELSLLKPGLSVVAKVRVR